MDCIAKDFCKGWGEDDTCKLSWGHREGCLKVTEAPESTQGGVSNSSDLLLRNLNHLMAFYAPEMCTAEKVNAASKAVMDAGGILAFLCDCKDLVRKEQ
jgi:hypothetical protein